MRQVLLWMTTGLAFLYMNCACGQAPVTTPKETHPAVTPAGPPNAFGASAAPPDQSASTVGTDVRAQLDDIKASLTELTEKTNAKDYTPALLSLVGSLVGVLLGAIVTIGTQRRLLVHQRALAEDQAKNARDLAEAKATQDREFASNRAKLEIGNSFVQWQLKQLSELYGPLHALFRESHALYRHMNTVLAKAAPDRFRFREDPEKLRVDGQIFEIKLGEEWTRFRTVLHLAEVYGREYGVEEYFDGVVAIGGRIVKVIEEKAGYVRPNQANLASLFGEYLAHYSVLERLNSRYKEKHGRGQKVSNAHQAASEELPMRVDESAVFPTQIQNFVDTGFYAINDELNAWRKRAAD